MITARLPGASIPVLLMRLKDGQLFERPKNLTKRRMLVASIVAAFAIVSAFLLARPTLVRSIQTQGAEALDAGQYLSRHQQVSVGKQVDVRTRHESSL